MRRASWDRSHFHVYIEKCCIRRVLETSREGKRLGDEVGFVGGRGGRREGGGGGGRGVGMQAIDGGGVGFWGKGEREGSCGTERGAAAVGISSH